MQSVQKRIAVKNIRKLQIFNNKNMQFAEVRVKKITKKNLDLQKRQ